MKEFYIGLHQPSDAWAFRNSMISVNRLSRRKSFFRVNHWILDSGAFSQLSRHGKFLLNADQYVERINFFRGCGFLQCAVAQDWMCEPFVLAKTGKSVEEHQELTIKSFLELRLLTDVPILPVLQGFKPLDYASHVRAYGSLLPLGAWVGVGSVCRRNGTPDALEDVLLAIHEQRADLCLHGFGLKVSALKRPTVRALLYSSDSLAWCSLDQDKARGSRLRQSDNDPRDALRYAAQVESIIENPVFVQPQLFKWWN